MNETIKLYFSRVHTSWVELPNDDWLEEPEPIRAAVIEASSILEQALEQALEVRPLWDGDLDEPERISRAEFIGYAPSFGAELVTDDDPPGITLRGLAVFVAVTYNDEFAANADADELEEAREDLLHAIVIKWRAGDLTFASTSFGGYSTEPDTGEAGGLTVCSGVLLP